MAAELGLSEANPEDVSAFIREREHEILPRDGEG